MNEVAPRAAKKFGEIYPPEPVPRPEPVLPIVLKGCLFLNLEHEEAVAKYGLWGVKILRRCMVHGQVLEPGDTCDLDGATTQTFVLQGRADILDKKLKEEAEIVLRATALGLPTKIRELVQFAPRKPRENFVRPKEEN